MNIRFHRFSVVLLLLVSVLSLKVQAEEQGELCGAFMNGQVDQSILATMLNAAERGRLFRIKAETSQVGFCVDSAVKRVEGVFEQFQGGMVLEQPGSHDGQTLVAVKSGSLKTSEGVFADLIKSGMFFDVEKYPEILFVSKDFKWISDASAEMTGDLTMHGITRQVKFTVRLSHEKDTGPDSDVLVKATTTLRRSDFGMDAMPLIISDEVQLCMTVRASRYTTEEA